MEKYRFQKWPFIFCLFSGLACAVALPQKEKEVLQPSTSNNVKIEKSICNLFTAKQPNKKGKKYSDEFPVGPHFLLISY